jgi:hypothetical protein
MCESLAIAQHSTEFRQKLEMTREYFFKMTGRIASCPKSYEQFIQTFSAGMRMVEEEKTLKFCESRT